MSLFYGYPSAVKADNGVDATSEKVYKTIFEINVARAVRDNGIVYHVGSRQIKRIKDGGSNLHQDKSVSGPTLGNLGSDPTIANLGSGDFISSYSVNDSLYMVLDCPRLAHPNVSVFVVLERKIRSNSNPWEYIIGNDDGSYDKYIAYKQGSLTELSCGGGFPVKERTCTIPNNIDTTQKHLVSCHWLMSGSHVRVNNAVSVDSYFDADWRHIGASFSSIFANDRRKTLVSNPLIGDMYGLKIVSGFLEPWDIDTISKEMMTEYNIV